MSLANKYRPTTFEDVCGQPITVTILKNFIANNMLSQPMLFVGPAGCGKTTCARIFATALNGEILEIDSASHNGVADVKEIVEYTKKASLTKQRKIVIFDEAHTITNAAWSSLLITLEEQQDGALFIFCTTDPQKIPDTILSRVQRFNFTALSDDVVLDRLRMVCKAESLKIDDGVLTLITSVSNGNMREALRNLDKCIMFDNNIKLKDAQAVLQIAARETVQDLFYLIHTDGIAACKKLRELQASGINLYRLMETALSYLLQDALKDCSDQLIDDIDFIIDIMQDLKFMVANPGNVCNFICARILTR